MPVDCIVAGGLAAFFAIWSLVEIYRDERRRFNERRKAAGLPTLDELRRRADG